MQIGPFSVAKVQAKGCSKKDDGVLEKSEAALDVFSQMTCARNKQSGTRHFFKDGGVLETSEAALDAFPKMTVSLVSC